MQYLDIWGGVGQEIEITYRKNGMLPISILLACFLLSYLIIFSVDQGQLELELSRINGEHTRTTLPI